MIKIIEYIILGIIQGFTEPIPISSSGHVMIINSLLFTDAFLYLLLTITNFGSLLAVCYVYKDKIINLLKNSYIYLKEKNEEKYLSFKYVICLIIATIPAGIIGLIVTKLKLFDYLESNIKFIGAMLFVTALLLFLVKNKKGFKNEENISYYDALIIGLYQIFALVPGISRSASTIVGGLFQGLKRESAFDFSFLLYIPISIMTSILGIKDIIDMKISINELSLYITSMITSFIVTYFSLLWFKDIVKKGKLIYFVIYCLLIGLLIILFI